jgi:capsular polysaccharide export protein
LTIDELVFGALIQYPRYVSRHSGLFIQPEEAIEELGQWRSAPPSGLGWWRRLFRQWGRWRERINPNKETWEGD